GVTRSRLIISPNHHVLQVTGTEDQAMTLPNDRLPTPSVALTRAPMGAANNARTSTSCTEFSAGRTCSRLSSAVQITASRVLPMLMPTATNQGAPAKRLTRKAPRVIAGHRLNPHRNRTVTARPDGNQISVANPLAAPSDKPSRPVPMYT